MVVQHRQRPPNKPFNPFGRGGSGPSLSYNDTRYRHTASRNTFRNAAGANARGSFSGCLSPAVLFVLVVIATISSYGFMSTPEPNGPVATSDKQEGGGIGAGALSPTKSASGALDKYGKSQKSGSARQSDSAMQKSGPNEYAEPEFPYHEQRDTNVQAYSYGDAAEEVAFPKIPPDLKTRNGNPFEHHRNQNLEEDKQGGVHSNSGPSADLQHRESQLVNEERQGDLDVKTGPSEDSEHVVSLPLTEEEQGGLDVKTGQSEDSEHFVSLPLTEEKQGDLDVKTGPSEDSEHVVSLPLTEEEQGGLDVKTGQSEDSEHFVSLPLTEEKQGDLDVKTGPSEDSEHVVSLPLTEEEQGGLDVKTGQSEDSEHFVSLPLTEEKQGDLDVKTGPSEDRDHIGSPPLVEGRQGNIDVKTGPSEDSEHFVSLPLTEEKQGDLDVKTGPSEDSEHVVSSPLVEGRQGDLDVKTGPSEDSEHFVSLPLTEEKQGDLDVKTGPSEDRDHIGSPPLVEEEQDDEASNRGSSAYHERTTNKSLAEEEQGDEESKTRPSDDPDHEGADQNDPDADEAKGLLPQIDSNDTVVTDVSIEKMRFKDEPSYLLQNAEEGKVQDNIEVERFGHLPPGMLDTETSLGKNFLSNETIEEDSFPSPVEISQAGNVTDAHSIAADINSTQPYLQANDTGFAGRHTIQSIAKTYANKSGTFVSENKFNTMFAGPTGAHDKSPIIEIPSIVDVIDGNFENKGNSSKLKSAYVVSKEADETDSLAGNASSSAETSPMTSERGSEPWSMESINNSLITKPVAASELEHKHVKDLVQINRISEESGGTQYKKSLNGGEDDTENLSTHSKLNVVPSTFFNESALTSPEAFVMSKLTSNHSGWPDPVTPASLVERREMDANVTQLYSTGSSYMSIATEKNATGVAKTLTKSAKRKPFENTTEHVNIKGYLKADGATRPKTMIATTAKSNITNIAVSQASLSASDANVTEWQSEALRNISKTDRDHPHRSLNLSAATFHQESVLRNKTHKFLHDKKTRHSHGKSPDKTRSSNKEKQIDTTDKNSALSPTRNTTLVVKEVKKQSREQDDPHLHDDDTGQHSESRNTTILKMHKSSARKSLRVKSS